MGDRTPVVKHTQDFCMFGCLYLIVESHNKLTNGLTYGVQRSWATMYYNYRGPMDKVPEVKKVKQGSKWKIGRRSVLGARGEKR